MLQFVGMGWKRFELALCRVLQAARQTVTCSSAHLEPSTFPKHTTLRSNTTTFFKCVAVCKHVGLTSGTSDTFTKFTLSFFGKSVV
jgi:hypothetical protein